MAPRIMAHGITWSMRVPSNHDLGVCTALVGWDVSLGSFSCPQLSFVGRNLRRGVIIGPDVIFLHEPEGTMKMSVSQYLKNAGLLASRVKHSISTFWRRRKTGTGELWNYI